MSTDTDSLHFISKNKSIGAHRKKRMDDWGDIKLEVIENGGDFWHLIEELADDESGFIHNRDIIAEAYKNGNLYGLRMEETDRMRDRGAVQDPQFCPDSWYLLPCFCVKQDNVAVIIWTHTRVRRRGLARKLVKELGIRFASTPLPGSEPFWKSVDVVPKTSTASGTA